MSVLSRDAIATLAKGAGFKGDEVNIAVAIALAESGGDTLSHNTKPPDNSYGLWQINMYAELGPSRRKWFGIADNSVLFDPVKNAAAAYKVYKASGWKAWTTYTRGTYKEFMNGGGGGTATVAPETVTENVVNATGVGDSGFLGIPGAINAVGTSLFKGFANVAGIMVAISLIGLGLLILLREPISNAIPASKIAKGIVK